MAWAKEFDQPRQCYLDYQCYSALFGYNPLRHLKELWVADFGQVAMSAMVRVILGYRIPSAIVVASSLIAHPPTMTSFRPHMFYRDRCRSWSQFRDA